MNAPSAPTPVDRLLAESRESTAVEAFARWHDSTHTPIPTPLQEPALARHYRKLIPLSKPAPGEQYAFQVDLDACSGCKACVTACHSLNGLEPGESWRSVGLLINPNADPTHPHPHPHHHPNPNPHSHSPTPTALQHVTTACHHCADPACLNGCPVLAYDKDPATGIVRHLDDQCIGCQYCILMCPYEVPRYSSRLGIVRKCDLCHDRLASGEAPACVQSCPNEAIRVTTTPTASLTATYRNPAPNPQPASHAFLPDAPNPALSLPSTRFTSASGRTRSLVAVDRSHAHPAHGHSPLVGFLVLSQTSVGLVTASLTLLALGALPPSTNRLHAALALASQLAALAIATSHLGQPLRAWRAFLGWRTSWFSREVLAFGAYTAALAAWNVTAFTSQPGPGILPTLPNLPLLPAVLIVAAALGWAAVGTSVMIYAATGRALWSLTATGIRFFGTTALAAILAAAPPPAAAPLVAAVLAFKWTAEHLRIRNGAADPASELGRSRHLLAGPLRRRSNLRLASAVAATALLTLHAFLPAPTAASTLAVSLAAFLLLLGETVERHLFFTAVSPQRMPGAIPS